MKGFKLLYLWVMNTKLFMGLYFVAIIFLTCILMLCFGRNSIGFFPILEMLLVAIFAAVTQVCILPDSISFLRGIFFLRSVAWLILVGVMTGCVAQFGNWFADLPGWCPWVLSLFMVAGCIAMLVGFRFEQESDTIRLNSDLKAYQKDDK